MDASCIVYLVIYNVHVLLLCFVGLWYLPHILHPVQLIIYGIYLTFYTLSS
jgi:hypothetical protein